MTPGHDQAFGLCFKCSGKLFKRFMLGKDMDRFMFYKDNSESLWIQVLMEPCKRVIQLNLLNLC